MVFSKKTYLPKIFWLKMDVLGEIEWILLKINYGLMKNGKGEWPKSEGRFFPFYFWWVIKTLSLSLGW